MLGSLLWSGTVSERVGSIQGPVRGALSMLSGSCRPGRRSLAHMIRTFQCVFLVTYYLNRRVEAYFVSVIYYNAIWTPLNF
jgi:hypothetical protein